MAPQTGGSTHSRCVPDIWLNDTFIWNWKKKLYYLLFLEPSKQNPRKRQEPVVGELKEPYFDNITSVLMRHYGLNFTRHDTSSLWFLWSRWSLITSFFYMTGLDYIWASLDPIGGSNPKSVFMLKWSKLFHQENTCWWLSLIFVPCPLSINAKQLLFVLGVYSQCFTDAMGYLFLYNYPVGGWSWQEAFLLDITNQACGLFRPFELYIVFMCSWYCHVMGPCSKSVLMH